MFQAWLTFAVFENARRGHRGDELEPYRRGIAEMLAPMTEIAAANPDAWYPVGRSVDDLATVRPDNRMVGYPYTKYMVSVMDVDMAAALVVATHERADALGVPADRRVYLRGYCYATDPVLVAARPEMWRSPAMKTAARRRVRSRRDRRRRRPLPRPLLLLRQLVALRVRCARRVAPRSAAASR